jgi:O-Antigen ligase
VIVTCAARASPFTGDTSSSGVFLRVAGGRRSPLTIKTTIALPRRQNALIESRVVPTPFGAIVLLLGFLASEATALSLQLWLCLFGAAAAISLPALGGATITPPVFFLPFLTWKAVRRGKFVEYLRQVPRAGLYIAVLALWGLLSAFVMPRLFSGDIQVLTVDRTSGAGGVQQIPLRPVSGNITQSAYALGAACAFLVTHHLLRRPGRLEGFRDATLTLGALTCLAAVINLLEFYAGLPPILEYVRTADYAHFGSYEAAGTGLMRIAGTFSEASAFAAFILPLFAFSSTLWYFGERARIAGPIALGCFMLLAVSTSTTAYVGLTLYFVVVMAHLASRLFASRWLRRARVLAVLCGLIALFVFASILFELRFAQKILEVLDAFVFTKLESKSAATRGMWNAQAWSNFRDSLGLGVGLGSARASSYPLVLLSNVGLLGFLLFTAFAGAVLFPRKSVTQCPTTIAARNAALCVIISACLVGTVFDLGVAFYLYCAAACSAASAPSSA